MEMISFDNINALREIVVNETLKHRLKRATSIRSDQFDIFDCEQLVYTVYRDLLGIDLRENGYGASGTTRQFTSTIGKLTIIDEHLSTQYKTSLFEKEILPGDILFFHTQSLSDTIPKNNNRYPGHEGIYLGRYHFMHADVVMGKVNISDIDDDKYIRILVGYKNVIDYLDYDDLINKLENKIRILKSSRKKM